MRKGCLNRSPFDMLNASKFLNAIESESFKIGVKNASGDQPAELLLYDTIGKSWDGTGVDAKDVAGFFAENRGKPVDMKINSAGGLVFDGLSIYNAAIAHDAPVTATITGIAASIASIIAMGADTVRMSAVGSMMIHRALAVCIGNEGDMADCGAWLKQIDNQLAAVYAAKTGRKLDTMKKYMIGNVDGTTFDAQTALDVRLIDEILPVRGDKPAARNVADDERAAFAEQVRIKLANQRAAARVRVLEVAE